MRPNLHAEIASLLVEDPQMSLGKIQKRVKARRVDVARVVTELRGDQDTAQSTGGRGNAFPSPRNGVPIMRGEATVSDTELDYPTTEDFEDVARMLRAPASRLLDILDRLQRHAALRSTCAGTYEALGDLMTFTGTFEETLRALARQFEDLRADLEPTAAVLPSEPELLEDAASVSAAAPLPLPPRLPPPQRGDVFHAVKGLAEPGA